MHRKVNTPRSAAVTTAGRAAVAVAAASASLLPAGGALLLVVLPPAPARAQETPPGADFRKGVVYGRVVDTTSNKPIAGAVVAIQDKDGKTISWTRTDAEGGYALATEVVKTLQLEPKRRRSLLGQIAGGIGKVVTIPVQVVGKAADSALDVVKGVDPIGAVKAALAAAVTANTLPAVAEIGRSAAAAVKADAEKKLDEGEKTLTGSRAASQQSVAKSILGTPDAAVAKEQLLPGEIFLAVSAPGFQDVRAKASAYWLEPEQGEGKKVVTGPRAWLETARLAPRGADAKKFLSNIEDMNVVLTDPVIDTTLVPAGSPVLIAVKVRTPAGQKLPLRVFARERKRGTTVEMRTQGDGLYAAYLVLDAKTPIGDTVVSLAALRSDPIDVEIKKHKTLDPMLAMVQDLDAMEDEKKFDGDPRLFAATNRIDIPITVLDPERATPSAPIPAPKTQP